MTEKSQFDKKNLIVLGIPIVYFLFMSVLSVYAWVKYGVVKPMDLFVYLLFMFVLIERASGEYTYEVDDKIFRITKKRLIFSPKLYEIPLENILGIYKYKAKLIGLLKFRHSDRMHSALDGRDVWTLAFQGTDKKGKPENNRVYIKPSESLLDFIDSKIPGRVKISEEEIAVRQFTS
jgi:hypothetical protein